MFFCFVFENNFFIVVGFVFFVVGFVVFVQVIVNFYEFFDFFFDFFFIVRQGFGFVCRSLFGGYVVWRMGEVVDGSDFKVDFVVFVEYWFEMCVLIFVVSVVKKGVFFSLGMQQIVVIFGFFQECIIKIVFVNMEFMEKVVYVCDFFVFVEVIMCDSNLFYFCCFDIYFFIFYMNDVFCVVICVVEVVNVQVGEIIVVYIFDVGLNCVVYYEEKNVVMVVGVFYQVLVQVFGWKEGGVGVSLVVKFDEGVVIILKEGVSRVIMMGVGDGLRKMEEFLVVEDGFLVYRQRELLNFLVDKKCVYYCWLEILIVKKYVNCIIYIRIGYFVLGMLCLWFWSEYVIKIWREEEFMIFVGCIIYVLVLI